MLSCRTRLFCVMTPVKPDKPGASRLRWQKDSIADFNNKNGFIPQNQKAWGAKLTTRHWTYEAQ